MQMQLSKITREAVEDLSNQNSEPLWLKELRLKAFSSYENLPKPNFIYGLGILIDASELDFDKISQPSIEQHDIPINEKITICSINQALKTHENLIKDYLLKSTDFNDKFSTMHAALFNRGVFIHVPKDVEANLSLDFLFKNQSVFDHTLIILEPFSKLNLIESTSSDNLGFRCSEVEIFAKESSQINYSSVQQLSTDFNYSQKKAFLKKDASINWVVCDLGGKICKSDVTTYLNGEGAKTNKLTFFFGSENQQFDLTLNVHHKAPYTESDLLTRGALNQSAKGLYRGLVKIHKNAPESKGYQKEDTLLLTENAEANAVPTLEIDNNNVKCSHGTTIGQIDKEKLFYLMSRGLSEEESKKKIIEGFFDPLIMKIKNNELREKIRKSINQKMNRGV